MLYQDAAQHSTYIHQHSCNHSGFPITH